MRARSLEGRVVVVTGAGKGIGRETTRLLYARGAKVAVVDRDGAAAAEAAAALVAGARAYEADVTDREGLVEVFARIAHDLGPIDSVVANAGIAGPVAPLLEADPEAVEKVIEVDLLGVWRTVHAALPHVVGSRGHVLLVASLAAAIACPTIAGYGAAKAGVESLGRSLRIELAPTGASAGVAFFGLIDTGLARDGLLGGTPLGALAEKVPWILSPAPVEVAAAAIVRGLERRSARVWAPRWVGPALEFRSLVARFDTVLARVPGLTSGAAAAPAALPTAAAAPTPAASSDATSTPATAAPRSNA
ncbi:MAG TPA: SDR family NAD(P)-dependent oxidoreductase [Acidimicrobiales bacterium]|nr:SDR family NAD(P)-dependent oxidoreductase [Acidimicrobiales bacterium]